MMNQINLLRSLNSATKYPAIPTYHTLGNRGRLTEDVLKFDGPVLMTEKMDGANGRIVKDSTGDWLIGARENFLTAKGDRIYTPTEHIVEVLGDIADKLISPTDGYLAYYIEVYGGNIGAAGKQYTADKETFSYRMFDIAHIPADVVTWPVENIALWREGGGQDFLPEAELNMHSDISGVPLTPRIAITPGHQLPVGLTETHLWLAQHSPKTMAPVDSTGKGGSEGIVLRTLDRKTIAKARHADYSRTLDGK